MILGKITKSEQYAYINFSCGEYDLFVIHFSDHSLGQYSLDSFVYPMLVLKYIRTDDNSLTLENQMESFNLDSFLSFIKSEDEMEVVSPNKYPKYFNVNGEDASKSSYPLVYPTLINLPEVIFYMMQISPPEASVNLFENLMTNTLEKFLLNLMSLESINDFNKLHIYHLLKDSHKHFIRDYIDRIVQKLDDPEPGMHTRRNYERQSIDDNRQLQLHKLNITSSGITVGANQTNNSIRPGLTTSVNTVPDFVSRHYMSF